METDVDIDVEAESDLELLHDLDSSQFPSLVDEMSIYPVFLQASQEVNSSDEKPY
jgi:hypothetical protein